MEDLIISVEDITRYGFTIKVNNEYLVGLITEYKYYVDGEIKSYGITNNSYRVTGLTMGEEYNNIQVFAFIR